MNIHEYQSKQIFKEYGLPVPNFLTANTTEEVLASAKEISDTNWVVKAQVHAGGRGKAGGVKVTDNLKEVEEFADKWIKNKLVTYQTDDQGQPVSCILVEERTEIKKEFYLGAVIDRSTRSLAVMASSEGGMDIEKVAEDHPEKIFKVFLKSPSVGNEDHLPLAEGLELSEEQTKEFKDIFRNLVKLFFEKDLSLVEINPLVLNGSDNLVCLDGKINIDSNALFRQDEILELRDISQEEEKELRASEWDLNYVSLEGNIGCLVNGAGLAMATMDIIKLAGGEPANFLDVGGAVDEKRVAEAFKIILEDENVKAILVNIFGGIVRCDVVADGIISAVEGVGVDVPVVVRLKGNNSEIAKEMLGKTNLNIIAASELSEAAEKAAEIVK